MALSKADLKAIGDMIAQAVVVAPRAKAGAKVARDSRTMAQRRDAAVGGACEVHAKRFATSAGYAYHMENTAHE